MIAGKFGVFRKSPDCPPPPPNSPRAKVATRAETSHADDHGRGVDNRSRSRHINGRCKGCGGGNKDGCARFLPDRTAAAVDRPCCKSEMDGVKCRHTRLFRWLDEDCSPRRFTDDQREYRTAVSELSPPIKVRTHRRRRYRTS